MKVHHLNCGTMRPIGTPDGLVCHVLLIEASAGLVLVDTGLGMLYGVNPAKAFGSTRHLFRPVFDEAEAAIVQVAKLGFDPRDVRHVVLTHFDADHTGGLADFPWAEVHLTADEAQAALHPRTIVERGRYLPAHRAHGPKLVPHSIGAGDPWRGFAAAKELTDIAPGIVLVGLPGHTRGHAAIAVNAGDRWILHAGDAFYHHGQVDMTAKSPRFLRTMERLIAQDGKKVRANHDRLAELVRTAEPDMMLVNAHDPAMLDQARGTTATGTI